MRSRSSRIGCGSGYVVLNRYANGPPLRRWRLRVESLSTRGRAIVNRTNRRDFLKLAASAGASVAVASAAPLRAEAEATPGPVRAWRTTKDEKFQPIESPPQ